MVAIFVALMFITFILTDLLIEKVRESRAARSRAMEKLPPVSSGAWDSWTVVPEAAYLSESHAWLLPEAKGLLRAGIDAMLAAALGRADRVVLPEVRRNVKAGEPLFHLELGGRRLTVASPVSGSVVSVNSELQEGPERLVESPYITGWICSLRPTRLEQERGSLWLGGKAVVWLRAEVERFREFIVAHQAPDLELGLISHDGGMPMRGCLAQLDSSAWEEFSHDFLRSV
ncbi:MAG TPA: hypothetical protein VM182_01615 [Terriglobia bacterium]|nr:hypothetical protein [Terriglobia bacterium]